MGVVWCCSNYYDLCYDHYSPLWIIVISLNGYIRDGRSSQVPLDIIPKYFECASCLIWGVTKTVDHLHAVIRFFVHHALLSSNLNRRAPHSPSTNVVHGFLRLDLSVSRADLQVVLSFSTPRPLNHPPIETVSARVILSAHSSERAILILSPVKFQTSFRAGHLRPSPSLPSPEESLVPRATLRVMCVLSLTGERLPPRPAGAFPFIPCPCSLSPIENGFNPLSTVLDVGPQQI